MVFVLIFESVYLSVSSRDAITHNCIISEQACRQSSSNEQQKKKKSCILSVTQRRW